MNPKVVQLPGEGDLDVGTRLATGGKPAKVSHSRLRVQLGVLPGAQHTDDGAELGQGLGRRALDGGQGLDGTLGI